MPKEVTKQIIDPRERIEVKATPKHPGFKSNPIRKVPPHMVPHLVELGMIEDPNGKAKK